MKFNIGERELDFDENTKELRFENRVFIPSVRTFGDMYDLYSEKGVDGTEEVLDNDQELYFMYRDVNFGEEDRNILRTHNIRYDITILIPKLFGTEYNKTYGHYHPKNKDGNKYQEIYQVLSGDAIYLQQKVDKVIYTKASTGDKVNMDEGFGHVTINPNTENFLVMANLVDDNFDSIYDDYKSKNGANYLYKNTGFEINPNYENDLEIKESTKLFEGPCMYDDFLKSPEKFNFLH